MADNSGFIENNDVGFWLKQLSINIEVKHNQVLAPHELTSSQFDVLVYLFTHQEEEVHQVDIEQATNRSNPTISGIIDRLSAKGFIKRVPGKKDKRFKQIVLTEKALEIQEVSDRGRIEQEEDLLRGFSPEERKTLVSYLKRLNENIFREGRG